jgi:adenylate cyclase
MAKETERKYRVDAKAFSAALTQLTEGKVDGMELVGRHIIKQAYVARSEKWVTRVRIYSSRSTGTVAELCLKERTSGETRDEFEYEIPVPDAEVLFNSVEDRISKVRYLVKLDGNTWEVDRFDDLNEGLVVAELEGDNIDFANVIKPSFVRGDVTNDIDYYNDSLTKKPYSTWWSVEK